MLRNGRLFRRRINCTQKILNSSSVRGRSNEQLDVYSFIPPRINRASTDILKALSNTVSRDPTAFHYQIPDDPFFYPNSNYQKRKRVLAIESGRKSARWIVKNNPGFFNHDLAEPSIRTFLNKPVFDESSEISEETLLALIQDRNVSQSVAVYNLLQNKGIDISTDAKQSLLELVCFYNSSERADEKDLWGKWYELDRKKNNAWIEDGFVKALFDKLEPECPLAYAALIQGMLKHNNLEEAMELFAAGKEKKIKFPVGVYNLMIENVRQLEKDPFKRFRAVEDYLIQMGEENIKPNLGTLNSVLSAMSEFDGIPLLKKESFVCKLLVEFDNVKIYPSLGSYFYILKIFVDQKEVPDLRLGVAWSVMDSVRRKRWTVQHPSDLSFFHFAMSLFCIGLRSPKLSQALMKFYLSHDHYKFLNTNHAESQFFDQYIQSAFKIEPAERSMEIYRDLVPSQMFLDIRRYGTIVKAIIQQKKFEYLEEIWKDMNQYLSDHFPKMTGTICLIVNQVSLFKKEETPKLFYEAALVLFSVLDYSELEATTLKDMLVIFIRFEDEEKVAALTNFIFERQLLFMEFSVLNETFTFAMSKKNVPLIRCCLELSYRENNPKLKTMGKEALPVLDATDQSWLNGILKKVDDQNKKLTAEESE